MKKRKAMDTEVIGVLIGGTGIMMGGLGLGGGVLLAPGSQIGPGFIAIGAIASGVIMAGAALLTWLKEW